MQYFKTFGVPQREGLIASDEILVQAMQSAASRPQRYHVPLLQKTHETSVSCVQQWCRADKQRTVIFLTKRALCVCLCVVGQTRELFAQHFVV